MRDASRGARLCLALPPQEILEQVNAAFKKYVKPEDLLIVKAGDFKKVAEATK